jgi:N utilization substance protein B
VDASVHARGRGRELALGALCHLESYADDERAAALAIVLEHPPRGEEEGESSFAELAADPEVLAFARGLVELVESSRAEIDAHIEATSRSWRLERMDRVDRNVVRIAAAELASRPDVPRAVVLAESVRLAARYGSERSATFVNGLVGALATRLRVEE